MLLQTVIEVIC